jgi:hypothetical protein
MNFPRTPKTRDCTIRRYAPGDELSINEMFEEVFQASRDLDAWRWKYMDGPYGRGCIALGFSPGGELISHYAGYLVQIGKWNGRMVDRSLTSQAGDKMTRPDARHRGMGKSSLLALTAECFRTCLRERGVDFHYGFVAGTSRRFGVRFLDYEDSEKVTYWRLPVASLASSRPVAGIKRLLHGWETIELQEPDEALDHFYVDVARHFPSMVCRDSTYLRWRYFNCPGKDYRVFALKSHGAMLGWGVFLQDGDRLRWGDGLFGRRVPAGAIREFLRQVVRLGGYADAEEIHTWSSQAPEWCCSRLRDSGFLAGREPNDLSLVFVPAFETDAPSERPAYFTWGDSDLF